MIFKTMNSMYEINTERKEIRRLFGSKEPTSRQGLDGEWKSYEEIADIKVGVGTMFVWRREDGVMKTTMTSKVIEIDVVLN